MRKETGKKREKLKRCAQSIRKQILRKERQRMNTFNREKRREQKRKR